MKKKDPSKVTVLQLLQAILANAKKRGCVGFLCIEAWQVFRNMTGVIVNDQRYNHASGLLREWISRQLEGVGTYESWVRDNHPEVKDQMDNLSYETRRDAYSEGRILWLEAMIKYLKENTHVNG
jgi:hypothetical protein